MKTPLLHALILSCIPCSQVYSQATDDSSPSFDAISIRQVEAFKTTFAPGSSSTVFTRHEPCKYNDEKVTCQLSLEELIEEAYQRKRYEVIGPDWLKQDLFAVQAILPDNTGKDQARLMLQHALVDRFGLSAHIEKRRIPVYEMVAAPTGLHLAPAAPPDKRKKLVLNGHSGATVVSSRGSFSANGMTLEYLGIWVGNVAGLDRPVISGTKSQDQYDIDLHWNPSDDDNNSDTFGDTGIIYALKQQAGIILQKKDDPLEVLVVDRVNRTPTPNP